MTGGDGYEPCAPLAPGAQECTLQYFADKGIADQVVPPVITMKDFEKVLERARPTVSTKDLQVRGCTARWCVKEHFLYCKHCDVIVQPWDHVGASAGRFFDCSLWA